MYMWYDECGTSYVVCCVCQLSVIQRSSDLAIQSRDWIRLVYARLTFDQGAGDRVNGLCLVPQPLFMESPIL